MKKSKKLTSIFLAFLLSAVVSAGFTGCNSDEPDTEIVSRLTGISISREPDNITYSKGQDFDPTGIVVEAIYRSGNRKIITDTSKLVYSGFDSSANIGSQTITVLYEENGIPQTAKFNIKISNISGLSITVPPRKTKYKVGDYAALENYKNKDFINLAELVLTVSKTDGSVENISIDELAKKELSVNNQEGDKRLINESGQMKMVEFLNSNVGERQWKTCTKHIDTPKTKEIYLDEDKSRYLVLTGFAFIKEDSSPQINIEYTEKCGDDFVTRSTSFGISVDYNPPYKFTDGPIAVDGKDGHYYLGDYPQTKKLDDVIVCTKCMDKGYFKYYAGSDGNYYVKVVEGGENYFKVEPIEWYPKSIDEVTGNHYLPVKGIEGGIPFTSVNTWMFGYNRDTIDKYDYIQKNSESTSEAGKYTSTTYKYYILVGTYKKSFVGDFLNGTNEAGTGAYNGKGFYQTAFSNDAGSCIDESTVTEIFFTSQMDTYSTQKDGSTWSYSESWDEMHPIPYTQKVALADNVLCAGDSAWELTDYVKQKGVTKNYMVNKNKEYSRTEALYIKNRCERDGDISDIVRGRPIYYLDSNMDFQYDDSFCLRTDLCIIPTIRISGK